MKNNHKQYKFSEAYAYSVYNFDLREQKAMKMLSVLDDFYSGELGKLSVLDAGCATGIIDNILSKRFYKVVGIDIDEQAVKYAKEHYHSGNLQFIVRGATNLDFAANSFDVIICAHIYQYIPNQNQLLSEIHRVLKPGGVCFFAAANRLNILDPCRKLPIVSTLLRPLKYVYYNVVKKREYFYEKYLSLGGLRNLVSPFKIVDYTLKIIENPERYHATESMWGWSLRQKIALWIFRMAYWRCPTYIWLLVKKEDDKAK